MGERMGGEWGGGWAGDGECVTGGVLGGSGIASSVCMDGWMYVCIYVWMYVELNAGPWHRAAYLPEDGSSGSFPDSAGLVGWLDPCS